MFRHGKGCVPTPGSRRKQTLPKASVRSPVPCTGVGVWGFQQAMELRRADTRLELTTPSQMLLAATLLDHFHCGPEAEVAPFVLRLSTTDFSRK